MPDLRLVITLSNRNIQKAILMSSFSSYTPRDPNMNSETYHYKRGANQQFSQVCHVFDPSLYPEEDLMYSFDREVMPIVIYCLAEEGEGWLFYDGHSDVFFFFSSSYIRVNGRPGLELLA